MDDLISRQAAIDAIDGEIEITGRTNAEAVKGYVRLVKDRLERLPSAQPTAEPVRHGKWIKADSQQYFRKHYPAFTCSECGQRKDSQKKWNYCPNCGARMDEE